MRRDAGRVDAGAAQWAELPVGDPRADQILLRGAQAQRLADVERRVAGAAAVGRHRSVEDALVRGKSLGLAWRPITRLL